MIGRQFGIKLKITFAFSVIFIFLSFSFNMYTYRRISGLMIQDNDANLISRAKTLMDKTELSPVIIPLPDANSQVRIFYRSSGKIVTVFQSPGIIRRIKTPPKTGVTDTLGMRVAYLVNNNEENPVELILVRSGEHLRNNLHYLLLLLFACSLISVVLAALIAYLLAVYLLKPIQRIINAAKTINANRLRDLIPVKSSNDELQELTETINTMLTRIDDSLQQQQRFFASASHELKTPLAIMKAELELEQRKELNTTASADFLVSQLAEINRLQQVVEEFLLVSQLKASTITLYKRPVDMSDLLLKIFKRLSPLMEQKSITGKIDLEREADTFVVAADHDKLFILFLNLTENAIKYGREGTLLTSNIIQDKLAGRLMISITNQTLSECMNIPKLLDAFERGDNERSGAGIGLWLAKQITALHNGELKVYHERDFFKVIVSLPIGENFRNP